MAINEQITPNLVVQKQDQGISTFLPAGSVSDVNILAGVQLIKLSGLAAGSIPYAGASPNFALTEDNTHFFYDPTNIGVRVGTNAVVNSGNLETLSVLSSLIANPSAQANGSSTVLHANGNFAVTQTTVVNRAAFTRTITLSQTDTAQVSAFSVGAALLNVSAGQTLTNTNAIGYNALNIVVAPTISGGGSIAYTTWRGINIQTSATNTGTTKIGLLIGGQSGATNNASIADSAPTGNYWLYSTSTSPSLFTGQMNIGNIVSNFTSSLAQLGVFQPFGAAVGTSGAQGIFSTVTGSLTAASANAQLFGLFMNPQVAASNTQNWTTTGSIGFSIQAGNFSPSVAVGATGTLANMVGVYAQINNNASGFTITNAYGLYIDTYGATGTISNKWGVFQVDSATNNAFAGRLFVGKTASTSGLAGGLEVKNNTAGTFSGILSDNGGRLLRLATSDYVDSTNTGSVLSFTMAAATGNTDAKMQVFTSGTSVSTGTLLQIQPSGGSVAIGPAGPGTGVTLEVSTNNVATTTLFRLTGASNNSSVDCAQILFNNSSFGIMGRMRSINHSTTDGQFIFETRKSGAAGSEAYNTNQLILDGVGSIGQGRNPNYYFDSHKTDTTAGFVTLGTFNRTNIAGTGEYGLYINNDGAAPHTTKLDSTGSSSGHLMLNGCIWISSSQLQVGINTATVDAGVTLQLGTGSQANIINITGSSSTDGLPLIQFFRPAVSNWQIGLHSSNNFLIASNGHNNFTDATFLAAAAFYIRADNNNVGIKSGTNPATALTVGTSGNNGMITAFVHTSGSTSGTTAQGTGSASLPALSSGTYTPTNIGLGTNTNVSASSSFAAQWLRVGNVVTVSGTITIQATAGGSPSALTISLPTSVASLSVAQCVGWMSGQATGTSGTIVADATNKGAQLNWTPSTTANTTYYYQFTYQMN